MILNIFIACWDDAEKLRYSHFSCYPPISFSKSKCKKICSNDFENDDDNNRSSALKPNHCHSFHYVHLSVADN